MTICCPFPVLSQYLFAAQPQKKIVETHSEEQQHTNFSISQNLVTVPILFASCGVISNSQAKLHNAVLNMAFGSFFFCRAQETDFLMSPLFIPHVKVFFTEIQNSFHLHVQKKN